MSPVYSGWASDSAAASRRSSASVVSSSIGFGCAALVMASIYPYGGTYTRPVRTRTVELLSRQDCHLCDDARRLVERLTAEARLTFTELDVDADPALRAEYGDLVPVVLVDGKEIGHWRIEESRLRRALR